MSQNIAGKVNTFWMLVVKALELKVQAEAAVTAVQGAEVPGLDQFKIGMERRITYVQVMAMTIVEEDGGVSNLGLTMPAKFDVEVDKIQTLS